MKKIKQPQHPHHYPFGTGPAPIVKRLKIPDDAPREFGTHFLRCAQTIGVMKNKSLDERLTFLGKHLSEAQKYELKFELDRCARLLHHKYIDADTCEGNLDLILRRYEQQARLSLLDKKSKAQPKST